MEIQSISTQLGEFSLSAKKKTEVDGDFMFLHFKTSPHLLHLFRRMLQHCLAVRTPERTCGERNLTRLLISMGLSRYDSISSVG